MYECMCNVILVFLACIYEACAWFCRQEGPIGLTGHILPQEGQAFWGHVENTGEHRRNGGANQGMLQRPTDELSHQT